MMLFATETLLQLIVAAGESASVLFLAYGAWLVLLQCVKGSLGSGQPT